MAKGKIRYPVLSVAECLLVVTSIYAFISDAKLLPGTPERLALLVMGSPLVLAPLAWLAIWKQRECAWQISVMLVFSKAISVLSWVAWLFVFARGFAPSWMASRTATATSAASWTFIFLGNVALLLASLAELRAAVPPASGDLSAAGACPSAEAKTASDDAASTDSGTQGGL